MNFSDLGDVRVGRVALEAGVEGLKVLLHVLLGLAPLGLQPRHLVKCEHLTKCQNSTKSSMIGVALDCSYTHLTLSSRWLSKVFIIPKSWKNYSPTKFFPSQLWRVETPAVLNRLRRVLSLKVSLGPSWGESESEFVGSRGPVSRVSSGPADGLSMRSGASHSGPRGCVTFTVCSTACS